jgi:polyisoprenoid-binding protein YceI
MHIICVKKQMECFMKQILVSTVAAALFSSSLFATCEYTQNNDMIVGFQAYKTPLKIGVGGEFDNIEYNNFKKSAPDLASLLNGSKVTIITASVDSANPARDKKLVDFFFSKMVQKDITAKITDVKIDKVDPKSKAVTGIVTIEIKMNNVTRLAELKFTYENSAFQADGVIDLADFKALGALASLNKACYDLHKGKTWSDVGISFNMTIKESCEK